MPYPSDIQPTVVGSSLGINGTRGRSGFQYGSAIYEFLSQDDSDTPGDFKIHANKSTDLGLTWTAMDDLNAPSAVPDAGLVNSVADIFTVLRDGNTAWIITVRAVGPSGSPTINGVQVTAYDLLTDTWGTPTDFNSPVPDYMNSTSSFHQMALSLCAVDSGSYQLLFSGPRETVSGTKYGRCYAASFDGSTFGTPVKLPSQVGNAVNYSPVSSIGDSGHRAHFVYTSDEFNTVGQPLYHVALDSDGVTFGSTATITDDLYLESAGGQQFIGEISEVIIFQISGTDYMGVVAFINDDASSTTQSIRLFYTPPVLNPPSSPWPDTIVAQGQDGDPQVPTLNTSFWVGLCLTVAYANGNLAVVWTYQDGGDTTSAVYRYSTSPAGSFSWTTDADLFAPSIAGNSPIQVASFTMSTGVGILGCGFNTSSEANVLAQFYFLAFGVTLGNLFHGPQSQTAGNAWQ